MKVLYFMFASLFFVNVCSADIYVLVNQENDEVKDVSKRDDAVVKSGYIKIVLPGSLTDYPIQYNPIYYKYTDRFIVNVDKLSTDAIADEAMSKIANFSPRTVEAQLFDTFGSQVAEQAFYGALSTMISGKDFVRLKIYAGYLLSSGKVTEQQYGQFYTIIKNNGIDLLEY